MKAVQYEEYGRLPRIVEVADPLPGPGDAVVAVAATGVCRSDWHAWRGHEPVSLPHIPGHEWAGRVHALGSGVANWMVGDRVTAPFVCGCGACAYCRGGAAQVCPDQIQPGFTANGSWAERVLVPLADTNLVALPSGVDDLTAAALGCRFATAYRALTVHGRLQTGQWLAVYGCGGVGLSAVLIGVALGARVIAVDPRPGPRQLALDLGAQLALDSASNTPTQIQAVGGVHVSIDAIGRADTARASISSLRRRGRHVQVGLLFGEHASPALPMELVVAHELEIYGSHGMAAHEYPAMLAAISEGTLDLGVLVGAVITLDEAGTALAAMSETGPAQGAGVGMTVISLSAEASATRRQA
ncbi:MAG: zinc-dependent alcohol dehydrogenase family protein [Ornithinimicrobium sp.]